MVQDFMDDRIRLFTVRVINMRVILHCQSLKLYRRNTYRRACIAKYNFVVEVKERTRFELAELSNLETFFMELIKDREVILIISDVNACKDER